MYDNKISVINNEYDYSNILPTIEMVSYLVNYCESIYKQFLKLKEEDEEKNKQFKPEFKNYMYKNAYKDCFEVRIIEKTYHNITCKDFETFKTAIKDGNVKNVNKLLISLDLSYKRGIGNDLTDYDNSFDIIFKPYEIKFARKSNHNEENMNGIEDSINEILKKFPIANSIFCTK